MSLYDNSLSSILSNSPKTTGVMPSRHAFSMYSGCGDIIVLPISVWILSLLTAAIVPASSSIAAAVSLSMSYPSCALNLTALNILSASSANLSAGLPTQRIIPDRMSSIPPKRSTMPSCSLYAMALIVKSRLFKSSLSDAVNSTFSGCLLSLYSPSILKVVTSYPSLPIITVTVPCSIPVSTVRRNMRLTSSGLADVVMSQSSGTRPITLSRTQPPTAYASYPSSANLLIICRTSSGKLIIIYTPILQINMLYPSIPVS